MADTQSSPPPLSLPNSVSIARRHLPRLHFCAYQGDLAGVLECITEGQSIHEALNMQNQHHQTVCGITPLFLAAQRGHTKVCKLLVENGANPNQPSFIENSTDICTPAEVARLNLHLMLARYLRKAVKQRRREDAVLAQDDEDAERQRRAREAAPAAPTTFMANLADLSDWDPATGAPANMDGTKVAKQMQKQGLDLYAWKPEDDVAARSGANTPHGGPRPSRSRRVEEEELEQPEIRDNGKMINKFLKDLDLQEWDPEAQGELQLGPQPSPSQHNQRTSFGLARGSVGSARGSTSGKTRPSTPPRRVSEEGEAAGTPERKTPPSASKLSERLSGSWRIVGGLWSKGKNAMRGGASNGQPPQPQQQHGGEAAAAGAHAGVAAEGGGAGAAGVGGAAAKREVGEVGSSDDEEDAALPVSVSRAAQPEDEVA